MTSGAGKDLSEKESGPSKWHEFYARGAGNAYPDENLVRVIRGQYADIPRSGRALDVGFGVGASLVMVAQSGYEAHGVEVSQASVDRGEALARAAGVTLNLRRFDGIDLPYPNAWFDIVISWNAVYYNGSRPRVRDALAEFCRVLRPGGVAIVSVIHPRNSVVERLSDDLGDGSRRFDVASTHDNRAGTVIFYEPTAAGWRDLFGDFAQVQEGYVEVDLFDPTRRSAWRLLLARKGE